MSILGHVEAKILVQIGDGEPEPVGTMKIPIRYQAQTASIAMPEPKSD